jgi:hypothetical protein
MKKDPALSPKWLQHYPVEDFKPLGAMNNSCTFYSMTQSENTKRVSVLHPDGLLFKTRLQKIFLKSPVFPGKTKSQL